MMKDTDAKPSLRLVFVFTENVNEWFRHTPPRTDKTDPRNLTRGLTGFFDPPESFLAVHNLAAESKYTTRTSLPTGVINLS